jgi:ribosomal protein S11
MYRIFRKEIVKQLNIKTRSPAWGSQICIRCAKRRLRVADISADEPVRIGGKRKKQALVNGFLSCI